jgi:hypothetical protein
MKVHNKEEREIYAAGINAMWTAFRYADYDPDMTLKKALRKFAEWIDGPLRQWAESGNSEAIGQPEFNGLIYPPHIERLPDGDPDV